MQVPIYQRQAQLQPINPNPDAFGVNINQARQEMGQQISNIGQLMQKRATERQEQLDTQKVLEADTQMRIEINNMLNSQELDENGKPKGLYNHTLANAAGITQLATDQLEQIRKKYSGMFIGENQQNQFNQLYKGVYDSTINSVAKHESVQFQASQDQTDTDNLNQKINDSAANPNTFLDNLVAGKVIIEVRGKQKGKSPESIKADYQDYAGKLMQSSIKTLLDAGNYKEAKSQFEKVKGELPGLVSETLQSKIDAIEWGTEQVSISANLLNKYGEDMAAADKDIKSRGLTAEKQKDLLETYHSAYTQREQERRATINTQVDYYYKNVESSGSLLNAVKFINTLPQKTTDQLQVKTNLLSIAKQLYGDEKGSGSGDGYGAKHTDPKAYWQLREDIRTGKVSTLPEMIFKYGSTVSLADLKTFANIIEKGKTLKTLTTECSSYITSAKLKDGDEQARFYDYVNVAIDDFTAKNGRGPNQQEQTKIIKEATINTITKRNTLLGFIPWNDTAKRYDLPYGFKEDASLGYNVITQNGKTYALTSWDPKNKKGLLQEVINKNGRKTLGNQKFNISE